MVYYKAVKIIINLLGLAKIIINIVIRHFIFLDSIITNRGFFFTSKFWLLLYSFLGIKLWLFIAFHLQTDSQIKKQNNIMEVYL